MRSSKKAIKRVPTKNIKSANLTDFAVKTAASVTDAVSRHHQFGQSDGKINVHIHVGDIILIGFDEAIDAEEWGMRENNTEIIGGKGTSRQQKLTASRDSDPNENKKTSRSVSFKKGALQLNATEHSEPFKKATPAKRTTRARKSAASPRNTR